MKTKLLILLILTLFLISGLVFLDRDIVENDEGIYWVTFLLADKGYKLYSEITFSQLPGFFISIYGLFKLFGSTIAAARFGVLYWSTLALLSIVWLGHIKKNLIFSLISLALLISIPTYFNQAITLQSDIIAVAFSTLSFVILIKFSTSSNNKRSNIWVILSALFFSLALLTKFDYSLVLPLGFLFLTQKKNRMLNVLLFSLISLTTTIITLIFFGPKNVLTNVLILRENALLVYPFEPFKIFEYLKNDLLLFVLVSINILILIFKQKKDYLFKSYYLWFISSLFLVISFRPNFHHHLLFLVVPSVLLFSNYILSANVSINSSTVLPTSLEFRWASRTSQLIKTFLIVLTVVLLYSFVNNLNGLKARQNSRFLKERETAKNFILENTNINDTIISDEAALYGMTGRLPPPELADLSYVQIRSGNITSDKFQSIIKKYKPKLVIAWNGRIKEIKGIERMLGNYDKIRDWVWVRQ